MSRIITGRLKLDLHPVFIGPLFEAAVDVIRPSAEAKRIQLHVTIDGGDSMVLGDGARIQQVIWNLLSNAVKFTNEGGSVDGQLKRVGNQVEVSVTDTGVGIDPQFLPNLFRRFSQADSTSTRRYGGLGLGLAIVRHVVEMHGGCVSASSAGKGQGSTFQVRFPTTSFSDIQERISRPLECEPNPLAEYTLVENKRKLAGVTALVVEDDPDTLEMLRFVLSEAGAVVLTAVSMEEAIGIMDKSRPDILVSDLAMPDQDGYDLIERLRSRSPEQGGEIPAVALTAYVRAEDRIRALGAGFQMHVPKPVDPEELVAVVASLIRRVPSKTS